MIKYVKVLFFIIYFYGVKNEKWNIPLYNNLEIRIPILFKYIYICFIPLKTTLKGFKFNNIEFNWLNHFRVKFWLE